jgi:hypothetical protein
VREGAVCITQETTSKSVLFKNSTFAHEKSAQHLENSMAGKHKQANITRI